MSSLRVFNNLEDALTWTRQQNHIAAEFAEPWQLAVKAGDHVMIDDGDCVIYSEILPDPPEYQAEDRRFWRLATGTRSMSPTGRWEIST